LTSILEDNDAHIDAIYYCPHHPEKGIGGYRIDCKCRKPKSGLIEAAAKDYGINLSSSYLIGDSERDIKAGNTVGVKTLLMAHDKTKIVSTEAAHVITDLSELKSLIHP
jgi:D-glycero-D-manno-heptose 1,7-bisphosphate phosphatase